METQQSYLANVFISYRSSFLLSIYVLIPYHIKTLAKIGIITPQAVRLSTVIKKPSIPVTTFAGDSCKIPKSRIPPVVVVNIPIIIILKKLSDRLFKVPAM